MPLHEVAHQGEQLQSQKPDGHAHAKNAITLRACTTSSGDGSNGPIRTMWMTSNLASGRGKRETRITSSDEHLCCSNPRVR